MTKQINIRVTDDEHTALAREADRLGWSVTAYAAAIVKDEANFAPLSTYADLELSAREARAALARSRRTPTEEQDDSL